jgi:hypothetical protein
MIANQEPAGRSADRQVIACNYVVSVSAVAAGARAYVIPQLGGNLPGRVRVLARSRGGRWIEKWEDIRRLGHFRLKTLPPEHPRYADDRIWALPVNGSNIEELEQARAAVA